MSGFRGIFLDSIHPLIVKRLDADTNAFKGVNVLQSTDTAGMKYFSERKVWTRVVPFAIPETIYTTDPHMIIEGLEDIKIPEWRNWVIWGSKAANIHSFDDIQTPYGTGGENGTGYHSSNVSGWGGARGLYRKNSTAWDGSQKSGIINSPVPGITNLQVSNKGDLGTIRRASFDIKVHNTMDLEAIEMMYMVPGLSVLVEWGWYHPELSVDPIDVELIKDGEKLASSTLINTEILKKSFGVDDNTKPGDATPLYNLEEYANTNHGPLGPRAGIYDGLLGVVTKFSWTNDGQGGYDCRVDCISPGSLAAGIPAVSYNLGGAETIDNQDIPVSDLRTVITMVKKESRVREIKVTEEYIKDQTASNLASIKLLTNEQTGNVTLKDSKADNIDIPGHKLSTAQYGIKIELDNTTDPPSLKYTPQSSEAKDKIDYFVGPYKGGNRQQVTKVFGDRTWWNKIMRHVAKPAGSGIGRYGNNRGTVETQDYFADSETGMKKSVDDIQSMLDANRCDEIVNSNGANETFIMALMEYHWGDAFRRGDFYVEANGNMYVKIDGKWISKSPENWGDAVELNNVTGRWWYPQDFVAIAPHAGKGHYLTPMMELPNQGDVNLGERKKVSSVDEIPGATTMKQAKQDGKWGGDNNQDKSGKTVEVENAGVDGWGDELDPVVVATQTGSTVYKRTEKDGAFTYEEVASVIGADEREIALAVKNIADAKEAGAAATRLADANAQQQVDAAITAKAANFGALTWAVNNNEKPIAFGGGKYHNGIYARSYPAYAPELHEIENKKVPSEVGYTILQGDEPLYPIGMVAYSETYLSWRFVEDYLLNELYMPKAVQPGIDKNNDRNVDLDTTFRSCNRLSDREKSKLSDNFLTNIQGLIKKENGTLTDESRDRVVYHSQHIINHKALRSFNPAVCILPGQESIPPFNVVNEDVTKPSFADVDFLLDGGPDKDGVMIPMSDKDADPFIKGGTVINRFAGLTPSGEYNPSIGVLRNIMINANLLEEAAAKSDNVRKFCLAVLDKVNKACGEPWSFKMLTNSALGKISIIDENYAPRDNVKAFNLAKPNTGTDENGVYRFSGMGSDNILKDLKIQSKIPNELQTMAYYSTMGTDNTKGSSIQMFNMYRTGIVDRLRSISSVTVLGNTTGSEEQRLQAEGQLIASYSDLFPQTRKNQTQGLAKNEAVAEGEKVAKQYTRRYIHGDTVEVSGYRPPIPIDVNLTLHGVSGIYMGNAIMINTIDEGGLLPSRYKHNVALQATSVDHSINAEGWTTEIGTLMRPLPDTNNEASLKVNIKRRPPVSTYAPTDLPLGNPFGAGTKFKITSQFGGMESFRKGSHGGVDVGCPVGTPLIVCLDDAKVSFHTQLPNNTTGYGFYVRMTGKGFGETGAGKKFMIDYGHCSGFTPPGWNGAPMTFNELAAWAKGQEGWSGSGNHWKYSKPISFGTQVAVTGGTRRATGAGSSTGPHLHMTIYQPASPSKANKKDMQLLVQDYYVAPGGGKNDHM